jgi:epoxyqueuosine reductase QueG
MQEEYAGIIYAYIDRYAKAGKIANIWQYPLVKFADAQSEYMRRLRELVIADHYMPEDFLPGAANVLSYYLPFKKEVGGSNEGGGLSSEQWADAYLLTNQMAIHINRHLTAVIKDRGYQAAAPQNTAMISEDVIMSRWSQRHIAWLAGHGTFGLNNMLISAKGCCGRYFSIVTTLPAPAGQIAKEEKCLYKSKGVCGACVRKCVAGALSLAAFDRKLCYKMCMENARVRKGAEVCGKCVSGLPCSFL